MTKFKASQLETVPYQFYNLFIDFDDTIVNSSNIIVNILNQRYNKHYTYHDVNRWDYSDIFPSINPIDITELFDSEEFFRQAMFNFYPNVESFIRRNLNYRDITVVSCGMATNLYLKEKFLNDVFGKDVKFIGIESSEMGKQSVNMKGAILIDDHEDNLISSNADLKILFACDGKKECNHNLYDNNSQLCMESWNE